MECKDMKRIDNFIDDLDNIGFRSDKIIKRAKWAVNLFILVVFPIIMLLSNAEVFIVIACMIPLYFSLQHLFEGQMKFTQRWFHMFKTFMMYALIMMFVIVIIENVFPSLAPVIYYTIK